MEGNKTGNEKFVIFIGSNDGYDRIAKPLTGFASIELKEVKERIKAELGEIAPLKNTPFEIICDEEGQLLGKPVTMHNGYQHLVMKLFRNLNLKKSTNQKWLRKPLKIKPQNKLDKLFKNLKHPLRVCGYLKQVSTEEIA